MADKTVLYIHGATIIHLDYGDELCRENGFMFSTSGRSADASHFVMRDAVAEVARMRAEIAACGVSSIEVELGEPVVRRNDMNPHGLI